MSTRGQRPRIEEQTQRELWARAAGRCQFRGCNELLYIDGLTQQRSNLAIISHIVGYSADGPRGDPVRSAILAKSIQNLMLTCRVHGKIIDDKAREIDYPEALLLEFKREHEQRVKMLTESREDAQTHVLLLQGAINARRVQIDPTAAFRAILPKYPAEEMPNVIDLSGIVLPTDSAGLFPVLADAISEQTHGILWRSSNNRQVKSLSIFALAPVPLLIHFGHLLGDIETVDLYQRHRDSQDWSWQEVEEASEFYTACEPAAIDDESALIALLLSVSDQVPLNHVKAQLGDRAIVYELRANAPSVDFLRSRKRLELFGYEARKLLAVLRNAHGHDRVIHVFAAVPAPIAVEFGRSIKAFDPPFCIYEYKKEERRYLEALPINPHEVAQ